MKEPSIHVNPPSGDDYEFYALTDRRFGALLRTSVELPKTIPISDGRRIWIGEHDKTDVTLVTVRWDRITSASAINRNAINLPYQHTEGFSRYPASPIGIRMGASEDHEFHVIPQAARTMIEIENSIRICIRERLADILLGNATWTPDEKGVRGLLLRAAQDTNREISLRTGVTRDNLYGYWAKWKPPALDS